MVVILANTYSIEVVEEDKVRNVKKLAKISNPPYLKIWNGIIDVQQCQNSDALCIISFQQLV